MARVGRFVIWGLWHGTRTRGAALVAGTAGESEAVGESGCASFLKGLRDVPLRSRRLDLLPRVERR